MMYPDKIPQCLKDRKQWVLWKTVARNGDKPTKLPYQPNGQLAKSNDRTTWSKCPDVLRRYEAGKYDGIGYVFDSDDPYCGIDLDGCRDPDTGKVEEWARQLILQLDTYAEVSPSKTGIKLFAVGQLPFDGRKKDLSDESKVTDKTPGIEVYDQLRYFAVTGWLVTGPRTPQKRQAQINQICERFWPAMNPSGNDKQFYSPQAAIERARRYIAKIEPAVSGSSGHNRTFQVACVLVLGFCLQRDEALALLHEYNQRCQPPWSDRELEHKIDDALKQPGERGYLRNAREQQWRHISVPQYREPAKKRNVEFLTLVDASRQYIAKIREGNTGLIDTGLPDLDYAIGGGIEPGEMIVLAARPSHGKSLVALQCAHNWTAAGMPILYVTEEMSPIQLGKRTLQYVSSTPQEYWETSVTTVEDDLLMYASKRSECYVAECCGTVEAMVGAIEKGVSEHGIKAAIVDYAQLLQSPGRTRYDQITHTSEALRRLSNEHKLILLVLCQMNRAIEKRTTFAPVMSDIKETGQFEQDADVIVFLVWPHRIDGKCDAQEYKFYVAKNRNRAINQPVVTCKIDPSRQRLQSGNYVNALAEYDVQHADNRIGAFDEWNQDASDEPWA